MYDNWKLRAPEDDPSYALNHPEEEDERRICCYCPCQLDDDEPIVVIDGTRLAHASCVAVCSECKENYNKNEFGRLSATWCMCKKCFDTHPAVTGRTRKD